MVSERWVRTDDGTRLWTATSGAGPPLVLCHGGPGMWDYLAPAARLIEDLVTVHRWAQRGCGRSDGSAPYTLDRFVADLEALRVCFGYDRWIVGGHSWGATLALRYAFAHPARVSAVVYLSSTGVGSEWRRAYHAEARRRLTSDQHRRLLELKERERIGDEEREYRTLSWAPDYADRRRASELAAREASASFRINYESNAALGAELRSQQEDDLLARCETLGVPVLIVHGSEDPRPAWAIDSMAAALPTAEVHVLPDVGHLPWLEGPEGFEAAVRPFLVRMSLPP